MRIDATRPVAGSRRASAGLDRATSMRYLVLSDIHANLEALEAVARRGRRLRRDARARRSGGLRRRSRTRSSTACAHCPRSTIIRGNHDKVGAGLESVRELQPPGAPGHRVDRRRRSRPTNRDWLAALPAGAGGRRRRSCEICHGSPFDEDVYIFDDLDARRAHPASAAARSACSATPTCPAAFRFDEPTCEALGPPRGAALPPDAGRTTRSYLVNCGAVGQPRDGDPRAAFGMLDTERARCSMRQRVAYDLAAAQAKIIGRRSARGAGATARRRTLSRAYRPRLGVRLLPLALASARASAAA